MNIELILIIACSICLLVLYSKIYTQSKALDEMYKKLRLLENNLDWTSHQASSTETDVDFMKGGLHDATRGMQELRQEIREINKCLDYLHGEKK